MSIDLDDAVRRHPARTTIPLGRTTLDVELRCLLEDRVAPIHHPDVVTYVARLLHAPSALVGAAVLDAVGAGRIHLGITDTGTQSLALTRFA